MTANILTRISETREVSFFIFIFFSLYLSEKEIYFFDNYFILELKSN